MQNSFVFSSLGEILSLNYSDYPVIFCDSLKALDHARNNGLSPSAKIKTCSPILGLLNDPQIEYLEANWHKEQLNRYQLSLDPITRKVFEKIEEAFPGFGQISAISMARFHRVIYKAALLTKDDFTTKRLAIDLKPERESEKSHIIPYWEYLLKLNPHFQSINYKNTENEVFEPTPTPPFYERYFLGGWRSILYRLALKYWPDFIKPRKNILILFENELLIDTVASLILKGNRPIRMPANASQFQGISDQLFQEIFALTAQIITPQIKQWVVPEGHESCLNFFKEKMYAELNSYTKYINFWNSSFEKLDQKNNQYTLLTSKAGVPISLAACHVATARNIPIIGFQHGVSQEICDRHDELSVYYDGNSVDLYIGYNSEACKKEQTLSYTHRCNVLDVGMSSRHIKIAGLKKANKTTTTPLIYISVNLYRGNSGTFCGATTDLERAQMEMSLIQNVFGKLKHGITYKTYPADNRRYWDPDPVNSILADYKNIQPYYKKIDMRFLLGNYRLAITEKASSTVSWPLLSNIPLVFIDWEHEFALSKEAAEQFKESVFYFNASNPSFEKDLREFLNQDLDVIERLYADKAQARSRLIKQYFSSYLDMKSGSRAAEFISNTYLS
jgi:hypothetical protein